MTPAATRAGLALALTSLGPGGCVDRVIHDIARCGDGVVDPGEVCLGQGETRTLSFDALEGVSLRVADFDGDGHLDLLLTGIGPSDRVEARLWTGHGDATFDDPVDPGLFGCSPYVTSGHLDDDAAADVLVDQCGSISVFSGSSGPTLGPPVSIPIGMESRAFGIVDLDADGRHEVVVLGRDAAGLVALGVAERQAGGGGFDPPVLSPLADPAEGFDPRGLGLLDLDGDARADALLVEPDDRLALSRGQPGLRFSSPEPIGPAALVPSSALVGDLDGDEVPDVLVASFEQEALVFLRSSGGQLVEAGRTDVPGLRTGPAGVGDIDNDARIDLLLFEPGTRKLQAWFGRGDGRFGAPIDVPIDGQLDRIGLADLDEDGALDIVAGTFDTGTIRIILGDP